jgi:chromatin remodeling complex protein RSC6
MMNASSAAAKSAPAKKVAKKEAAPAVAAPAPVAAAPAAEAAPKKAAGRKAAEKPAAAAAPATASTAAPVVVASTPVEQAAAAAPAVPATTLDEDLKAVTAALNTLKETASTLLGQVKKLEKRVHREIKDARKRKRRSKTEEGAEGEKKREPSVFERPTQVTDELNKFLGRPAGTLMSRSEVTKAVNNYVKEKGLKNKHDIKPDAALKKLLAIGDGDNLTYFNLQRYLNRHYIKATPAATA